jgi:uncharacterized repeat protein (TIGR01451 family)
VIRQQAQKTSLLGLLTCFVVGAIVGAAQSARAEGSYELIKDAIVTPNQRPFTELRLDKSGGLTRQTIPQVYAKNGEVIHLGSSGLGVVGIGNIKLYAPGDDPATATPVLDCAVAQPGKGILDTHTKEAFGPHVTATDAGYESCKYTVPAIGTGIYTVILSGPAGITAAQPNPADPNGTQPAAGSSVQTPTLDDQRATVAIWDVTVRSSATSAINIKGRVFVDKLALYMVGSGRLLKSELFILTDGGYRYRTDLSPAPSGKGLDPNGFIFLATDRGVLKPDGTSLYGSGISGANDMPIPLTGGITLQPPQHKIFFNPPSAEATLGLGYPLTANLPVAVTNFQFIGQVANQTPEGVGGTFKFTSTTDDGYQIIIDADNDGNYTAGDTDRVIDGTAIIGQNSIVWDGKNNLGNVVAAPASNVPYKARIISKGGEYHFPLLDVENNADGFTMEMLNPPGLFPLGQNKFTVFYDERNYTSGGVSVPLNCSTGTGNPPCNARGGIDSDLTPRKFVNGYGDKKAVDTWIYFPSSPVLSDVIIQTTTPSVSGTKSVKVLVDTDGSGGASVGDQIEYLVTYQNTGGGPANSFVLQDNLPASLQFVSAAIASQTNATLTLNATYAGTGNLINAVTLPANSTVTIKVVAKILAASTTISNQAIATYAPTATTVATVKTDATTPTGSILQLTDDGVDTGNDTTKTGDDDPTLITVAAPPRIRLVKRITKVAANTLTNYVDLNLATDTTSPDDNAPGWPNLTATATQSPGPGTTSNFSSLLKGAIDNATLPTGVKLPKPNEDMEYTIYFLSDGGVDAQSVSLCDFIPLNNTYVAGSLEFSQGGSAPVAVTGGAGGFLASGLSTTTGPCKNGTDNGKGGVVVNLNTVPRATASGTPASSYGFIRFRTTVK